MRELQAGQNHPIEPDRVTVGVSGEPEEAFTAHLQAGLLLLDQHGQVSGSGDVVCAEQPRSPDSSAVFAKSPSEFELNLSAVPATVVKMALVLAVKPELPPGVTLGIFAAIRAWLADAAGQPLSLFPLPLPCRGERALILAEFYRHREQWKFRAVGQGFAAGLPALAAHFGMRLTDLPSPPPAASPSDGRRQTGPGDTFTGTGFCIHPDGYILTNHHVIKDARQILARSPRHRCALELVFADPTNDLALLRADTPPPGVAKFRDGPPARLGETVVVVGYPLGGLLGSGPQVTTGNVSSLIGPGDDTRSLQFTAPIQAGNSGSPLLDSDGTVVGVVSAKLNAIRIHEITGDVPQNINFAIKAMLARGFLEAAGIDYHHRAPTTLRTTTDIAAEACDFVLKIECQG